MELKIKNAMKESDVLVIGGGPAGCMAALAAARDGMKVTLLEAATCLGGMATSGLVSKWAPFTDKEKVIYKSQPVELMERYKKAAGIEEDKWDWVPIHPEILKTVYDEMLGEAGVHVLFATQAVDAIAENGEIQCVIAANKAGLTPYKAKIYIDCTGDGDVAAMAGAETEKGDENGNIQPASLCFMIANADMSKCDVSLSSNPKDGLWAQVRSEGKFPLTCKHFIPAYLTENRSVILANAGHLNDLDSTDPEALSDAYRLGRKTAQAYLDALKHYLPEVFKDALIVETAPEMGTRESRRVLGEYVFTVEDFLTRRSFEDEISRNCYYIDCHAQKGTVNPVQIPEEKKRYAPGESHGIPWRCLVPRGFRNLLVAGRCLSVERMALASLRVMPNCLSTGEAAGHGAAIAVSEGLSVREIPAYQVQERIRP